VVRSLRRFIGVVSYSSAGPAVGFVALVEASRCRVRRASLLQLTAIRGSGAQAYWHTCS
jgi:hypothetical protein